MNRRKNGNVRVKIDSKMREGLLRIRKVMGFIRLITRRNLKFEFIEREYSREIERRRSFKCT